MSLNNFVCEGRQIAGRATNERLTIPQSKGEVHVLPFFLSLFFLSLDRLLPGCRTRFGSPEGGSSAMSPPPTAFLDTLAEDPLPFLRCSAALNVESSPMLALLSWWAAVLRGTFPAEGA